MATQPDFVGITPTFSILRDVLVRGIADLRRYPEDLEDVFERLTTDDETAPIYGEAERDQAIAWFRRTDVPVRIVGDLEPPSTTSLTIALAGGREDKQTLGDINFQVTRQDDRQWRSLVSFVPDAYDAATGEITLPASVTLIVVKGMVVVDRVGRVAPVLAVPGTRRVRIAVGPVDLSTCEIRGARPTRAQRLESVVEAETLHVSAFAHGEPVYATWLFTILKYILYRSRISLTLRGMSNVSYNFTGPAGVNEIGPIENMTAYVATVSCLVRQTWARRAEERIYSVEPTVSASEIGGDEPAVVVLKP